MSGHKIFIRAAPTSICVVYIELGGGGQGGS